MQWRKWRKWRKIASCWRFELDAKSGPLEVDDFGENGDFGKNRHACNIYQIELNQIYDKTALPNCQTTLFYQIQLNQIYLKTTNGSRFS